MAVTRHAATLDTGLVASGYPGGSLTHLSSTHFQYARAIFCSSCFYLLPVSISNKERFRESLTIRSLA